MRETSNLLRFFVGNTGRCLRLPLKSDFMFLSNGSSSFLILSTWFINWLRGSTIRLACLLISRSTFFLPNRRSRCFFEFYYALWKFTLPIFVAAPLVMPLLHQMGINSSKPCLYRPSVNLYSLSNTKNPNFVSQYLWQSLQNFSKLMSLFIWPR